MVDRQTEAMRALVRIRTAEAELEALFTRVALDMFNTVLVANDLTALTAKETAPGTRATVSLTAALDSPDKLRSILSVWRDTANERLIPAVMSVYRRSAAEALKRYPALVETLKRVSPDYLNTLRNLRADAVLATVSPTVLGFGQDAFAKAAEGLQTSLELGEGIPKASERVREALGSSVRTSRMLARTVAGTAVNGGDYAVAQEFHEAGLVSGREWLATGDGDTRPAHMEANGDVAVIGEPFTVGGVPMMYPGDLSAPIELVANCRCATTLVLT